MFKRIFLANKFIIISKVIFSSIIGWINIYHINLTPVRLL